MTNRLTNGWSENSAYKRNTKLARMRASRNIKNPVTPFQCWRVRNWGDRIGPGSRGKLNGRTHAHPALEALWSWVGRSDELMRSEAEDRLRPFSSWRLEHERGTNSVFQVQRR